MGNKMIPNRRTSCREVQWSTIRFRKRTEKVDAQKRVDKPHMIADALLEKAGEKVLEAKRHLGTVHLDPIIDQIPCGQGDKQFGNVVLVEWGEMPCAGTAEQKISADHEKKRHSGPDQGIDQHTQVPGGAGIKFGIYDDRCDAVQDDDK